MAIKIVGCIKIHLFFIQHFANFTRLIVSKDAFSYVPQQLNIFDHIITQPYILKQDQTTLRKNGTNYYGGKISITNLWKKKNPKIVKFP
jgi:hypothetical protein